MRERRFRCGTASDCQLWVREQEKKRDLLQRKESAYWNCQIIANQCSSKKSWKLLNNLMMRDFTNVATSPVTITAETLWRFFQDKVRSVRESTIGAKEPTFIANDCQVMTDFRAFTAQT